MKLCLFLILLLKIITTKAELPVLPGSSQWGMTIDPVTFEDGQNIFEIEFSDNCITSDGKWRIACGLFVKPILETETDISSKIITKTSEFTRDETVKMEFGGEAGFWKFKVKGRFSKSNEEYINTISMKNETYVYSNLNAYYNKISTSMLTMKPSKEFLKFITILNEKLVEKDTEGYKYWLYEFAKNFAFTTIVSVTTGARLEQRQYIQDDYYQSTERSVIQQSASASASFSSIVNIDGSKNWGVTKSQIDKFITNSNKITTKTIGGYYRIGMSLSEWQQSAELSPAILEYILENTSFWINSEFLSQFESNYLNQIKNDYENLYLNYIDSNTYLGCTDKFAMNFMPNATVDNQQCVYDKKTIGSVFAGFYKRKELYIFGKLKTQIITNNPFTNAETCPGESKPYCTEIKGVADVFNVKETICVCQSVNKLYGYSFFGWYLSTDTKNPVTESPGCPAQSTSTSSDNNLFLCYSDKNAGYVYGGTFSYYGEGSNCRPNIYTSQCSCPEFAPNKGIFYKKSGPGINILTYICYGKEVGSELPKVKGNTAVYKPMIAPNYEPKEKHSINYLCLIILLFLAVGMIIVGILLLIRTKRNKYQEIA